MDVSSHKVPSTSLDIELSSRPDAREYSDRANLLPGSQTTLVSNFSTVSSPLGVRTTETRPRDRLSVVRGGRFCRMWLRFTWLPEYLCCSVALAVLISIIAILYRYQNASIPELPYRITINTLISILVTVLKSALAIPLCEAISQLKWIWFSEKRPLYDMATFDSASRGALGAARLLVLLRGWHLAALGSILVIVNLAIGPFSQQMIRVKVRNVPADNAASIPVCGSSPYDDFVEGSGPGEDLVALSTIGAIYDGLLQNNLKNSVATQCGSGNCTFMPYQSLGFCSQCAEISDQITTTIAGVNTVAGEVWYAYSLPQGLISSDSNRTTINTTLTTNLTVLKPVQPIVNFTALIGPGHGPDGHVSAIECALSFCVKTYDGVVRNGIFKEVPRATTTTSPSMPWVSTYNTTEPVVYSSDMCFQNGSKILPPYRDDNPMTPNCSYKVSYWSHLALVNTLAPLLTGYGTRQVINRPYYSSYTIEALLGVNSSTQDVMASFNALAPALTTHARSSLFQVPVHGTTWVSQSYVEVRWRWAILPGAVTVLTIVFFALTVLRTRKKHVWKSSPLALLFYGPNDIDRTTMLAGRSDVTDDAGVGKNQSCPVLQEMRKTAKRINVRLKEANDGGVGDYRLVHCGPRQAP